MKVVWTYTRTYNHIEYYFFYPDLYMEWLCTYWINGVKTRSERQELLSLLCLELSSILDEDPDEAQETVQKAALIKEKAPGRAQGHTVLWENRFQHSGSCGQSRRLRKEYPDIPGGYRQYDPHRAGAV